MSEAELHILKARLRGGITNKAQRGEYRTVLPVGLVYDSVGKVTLDPDTQIRETIAYFFETFIRVGSAHQTVKVFRNEGLLFPSRGRKDGMSAVVFRVLTASAAVRMLHNPRYAGVYSYGRRRFRKTVEGKLLVSNLDFEDWTACIPNAHPGYITWEQYKENIKILQINGRGYEIARKSPPREGAALLKGRVVCSRCGRFFSVRYRSARGKKEHWYICNRAYGRQAAPLCQSIAGDPVEEAVASLVVDKLTPAAVDQALEVRKEVEARRQETEQLHVRAIESAQYEADLAQRRYLLVDPNNRLVADTLEADWNQKLRTLEQARKERERCLSAEQVVIDDLIRELLIAMIADFKQLWREAATTNRERKRMLAQLIEDVTLLKAKKGTTRVQVRFKGGQTETLITVNPKASAQMVKTDPKIIALVNQLLDDHIYSEIAALLNQKGFVRVGRLGLAKTKTRALMPNQWPTLKTPTVFVLVGNVSGNAAC